MKVTTQSELDAALADPSVHEILIDSPRGVWIDIPDTRGKEVVVGSTATINKISGTVKWVYSGGTVERVDSGGTVERVYSGGTVKWVDSGGTVERVDSGGTVERVDSGGTVERVYSGGTVKWVDSGGTVERVYSGGTVEWVDSGGTVERVDSGGTVERVDSGGTVERVYSGGTVHLDGGRIDRAGSHAAVFLHSASVVVSGGILIDLSAVDITDPKTWCDFYGVDVIDGAAILYKAVDDDFRSAHTAPGAAAPFQYPVGETVIAPDWADNNDCGGGLHFSPSPVDAQYYNGSATRFVKVSVPLEVLRPIDDGGAPKCKAQHASVLVEVTVDAELVEAAAA